MPVMVVRRGDVCPAAAGYGSEESRVGNVLRQGRIRLRGHDIEKVDKRKAWAYSVSGVAELEPHVILPDVMAMKTWKTERSG